MVEGWLRCQSGVIAREQALSGGMSAKQIDRRLASGWWVRVYPGVYLAADRELTDEARILGAWLWAGESSTVSGLAAAWWHGLWPDPPPAVEITVPARRRLKAPVGVRVRRRDLVNTDRIGIRGLWLTDVPLTVLETAVTLGERGSQLVDRALQRRVRFDALRRAHFRNLGRRGSTDGARLLAVAADRAASEAERRMMALLRSVGLTGWRRHYVVNGYELDFAFRDHRVAVEVDGWAWHHEVSRFRLDRQRQNNLVLAGWTVLRFTWHDLVERAGDVLAEIRTAVGSAAA